MIKKRLCLMIAFSMIFVGCSCNSNGKDDNNDVSKAVKQDMQQIIDYVENHFSEISLDNQYYYYNLTDNVLSGNNYNSETKTYENDINFEFTNIDFTNGMVVVNQQKQLYITMENANKCAKKDFDSDEIEVYDISESEKCHTTMTTNGEINLYLYAYTIDDNQLYGTGEVINMGPISLFLATNIIDRSACTYKWFRNGEEISDSNYSVYTVMAEQEDAEYTVEVGFPDGQKVVSSPYHLIIQQ